MGMNHDVRSTLIRTLITILTQTFKSFSPCTRIRNPGENKVPVAAGAFDTKDFVSGIFKMEPGAVKALESVRNCTQVKSHTYEVEILCLESCLMFVLTLV